MIRAGVLGLILIGLPALVSKDLPHVDPGDRCTMAIVAEEGEEIIPIEPEIVEEPAEVISEPAEAVTPEPSNLSYYGNCRLTFYDVGPCCCGQWAGGHTASGTVATVGRTVACGDLLFGTHLLIEGQEYVVEDRGVGAQQIDILVSSHEEALARGLYYADVWIIN